MDPTKGLFTVSWNEDDSEFVVVAADEADAIKRFLANREAAGALPAMQEEADGAGEEMPALVNVGRLTCGHGHDVFSLDRGF